MEQGMKRTSTQQLKAVRQQARAQGISSVLKALRGEGDISPGLKLVIEAHDRAVVGSYFAPFATAKAKARLKALEDAVRAASTAKLPPNYKWGRDAMEAFNFGKARAALAIRSLMDKKK